MYVTLCNVWCDMCGHVMYVFCLCMYDMWCVYVMLGYVCMYVCMYVMCVYLDVMYVCTYVW